MKQTTGFIALAVVLLAATPAVAASDMHIKFEGVDGESAIAGWSFGACNSGQCTRIDSPRDQPIGQSSGKVSTGGKKEMHWDLATAKGARSAGGVNVAAGDIDGDGRADLAYAGTLSEVTGLSLTFSGANPSVLKVCAGKHIAQATLRIGEESYSLTGVSVTCTSSVAKQTQGATFGEKVQAGLATAGGMIVTFAGGQMRHTKSGHVTLLK